jgi:hypothetical protein
MLDRQQLQTFVSIAQGGSIAAGARAEAISPHPPWKLMPISCWSTWHWLARASFGSQPLW